jgi:hypothetical protein
VGALAETYVAHYTLKDLAERGVLDRGAVNGLLIDAGLEDFGWDVLWAADSSVLDADLPQLLSDVDGYVLFIHGWTGSRAIWEDLPASVVAADRRLVALIIDHNGFGASPFVDTPGFDRCSPVAAMEVVERWIELLGLRRAPGDPRPKTVNFVGHSMGGAALFFLDESRWRLGEQTRTALAPALLLHDDTHRAFYDTLGLGIGLVGRIGVFEVIEQRIKPRILEVLTDGATDGVRAEHLRVYNTTAHGVIARTLAAMGVIRTHPAPHRWDLMRVTLGNRDRLVGLLAMLELLDELYFDVDQVRVVFGSHYFFSVGESMARTHAQARDLVLQDILTLHQSALRIQRGR